VVSPEAKSEESEIPSGGQKMCKGAVKNKKEAFKSWQKVRHDASLKAVYTKACKETNRVVAKAKNDVTKHIYDDLDTKEGPVKIYTKLQKCDREPDQTNCR